MRCWNILRFLRYLLCRKYFTGANGDNGGLEQLYLSHIGCEYGLRPLIHD